MTTLVDLDERVGTLTWDSDTAPAFHPNQRVMIREWRADGVHWVSRTVLAVREYDDRTMVNCHVNWLSPVKVRQMIIAGSKKSLIFNELNTTEPIKVYNRGIDLDGNVEDRRKLLISYRSGDVLSPHLEPTEALQAVVSHFAECVRDGKTPISDGRMGLRVVRLLESATRSIRAQGGRVVLTNGAAANGGEDARTGRPDELHPDLAGRPNRKKRGHTLLR